MTLLSLTLPQARALMLAAQGLLQPPAITASKDDVLACIRQMGALQIDTIHVVARSPYLVLWSRLGAYTPAWLDEHLAEGRLFEYWAHAACFLPSEDFGLHRQMYLSDQFNNWYRHWYDRTRKKWTPFWNTSGETARRARAILSAPMAKKAPGGIGRSKNAL